MERSIGSMGSEYTRFRFPPEEIPVLAKLDWTAIARRVFIDPASGLVALMSPSSKHERYAWATGRLMDAVARGAGLPVIALGATRWRRPEDPVNTGAEPDACYYLGRSADLWTGALRLGETELESFELRTPPDLVIEVERSRGDEDKPDFYRRLGVPEMWRLDIAGNRTRGRYARSSGPGRAGGTVFLRCAPACRPRLRSRRCRIGGRKPPRRARCPDSGVACR